MKLAIMQPYFFPYIGYFQLINAVDVFVLYDNIQYTKKGWINRNRILNNGSDMVISLPIKKDSDYLNICDRELSEVFIENKNKKHKMLNQIRGLYSGAPFFKQTFQLIEKIIWYDDKNLFGFIYNSIMNTLEHLNITTKIKISSDIDINHNLKSQSKVIAICKNLKASTYINAIGGTGLYNKNIFLEENIDLKFIKSKLFEYKQFKDNFCPWLSIIDVMMFNSVDKINNCLNSGYELIDGN